MSKVFLTISLYMTLVNFKEAECIFVNSDFFKEHLIKFRH